MNKVLRLLGVLLIATHFSIPLFSQWVPTNGPYGGDFVCCFAVSGNKILAGTENHGVFISTDGGTSWDSVNTGLTSRSIYALAVLGTNIFASTGNAIFLTTNNGTTWSLISTKSDITDIYTLLVSGNNLIAGTNNSGIFLSTNNGVDWLSINTGLTCTSVTSLAISGNNLFAGTVWGGIFLSTNNGTSWNQVNSGLPDLYCRTLAVHGKQIFAAIGVQGHSDGVFLSTDNGATWSRINNGMPDNIFITSFAFANNYIYAGSDGEGVYCLSDTGTKWTEINNGMSNRRIFSFTTFGKNLLAGSNGSSIYFSSDNGAQWTKRKTALNNTSIRSLTQSENTIYASTYGNGIFFSTDEGDNWSEIDVFMDNLDAYVIMTLDSYLLAGTDQGIFSLKRRDSCWTATNIGLQDKKLYCLNKFGSNLYAGTTDGAFHSSNNGESWANIGLVGDHIYDFAFYDSMLLVVTGSVVYTIDEGMHWFPMNYGLPPDYEVSGFANIDTNLYTIVSDHGVYHLTNYNREWNNINCLSDQISCLIPFGSKLFAGSVNRVYLLSDNGLRWGDVSDGLITNHYVLINSFIIFDSTLFAGTSYYGVGVWKRKMSEMVVSVEEKNKSENSANNMLKQNYPNPFNSTTNIEFSLPQPCKVTLEIFDIFGEKLTTLITDELLEGNHKIQWNAESYSGGVYLCRLNAGLKVETRVLILQR